MPAAIEIEHLSVVFPARPGDVRALDDLSLTVEQGRVFGFLGPNGAGKTTAMQVLLDFVRPTTGRATVFGCDVSQAIARERIGYLPEHPETYRFLTGRELLDTAGRMYGMRGPALRDRVGEVLHLVNLAGAADRRAGTYSRGMLQRIGLGQALINDPDLLILDEPTSGLDPIGRMDIRRIIDSLRARGKTVFFSSHELSEVELVCDSIAILARGRVVLQGPTSTVVGGEQCLEKLFLKVVA